MNAGDREPAADGAARLFGQICAAVRAAGREPRKRASDLRLARFFGTSERFWMNLQSRYDLEIEKDRLGPVLDNIQPLTAAS